jgi:hypothetical protein
MIAKKAAQMSLFSFGLDDAVDRRRALEADEVRAAILAILEEGPLQDAVMLRTSYSWKSSGVFSMTSSETPSLSLKWSLGWPSPAASAAIHEFWAKHQERLRTSHKLS